MHMLDVRNYAGFLWRGTGARGELGNARVPNLLIGTGAWIRTETARFHGTWARLGNMHVVGSLRADTLDPSLVTFEHYPTERLAEIKSYAVDAVQNCKSIIARLEASRHISPESQ